GELNWRFSANGRFLASPVIIEDKIYIGATDGKLYEINIQTGKMTDFFQATERITNKIAYNAKTKRFFLPTYANEIYCLEKI
ncbi:MAG: PQQ-binding-like beta-propeller repeat protein, partial [Patescibacteria group bacterium]